MASAAPSARALIRRAPGRADYARETIDAILDEGLVAHVAVAVDGQPFVIPTLHARVGNEVYIHGSTASRLIRALTAGAPTCLTVTLLDGVVLARSAFHHSCNYRSVVVLGRARIVTGEQERLEAMRAFTERIVPGRWQEVRRPNRKEMKATQILALGLDEASAKLRSGGPVDDEEDYALGVWAGHVPLRLTACAPLPDPRMPPETARSSALTAWLRARE